MKISLCDVTKGVGMSMTSPIRLLKLYQGNQVSFRVEVPKKCLVCRGFCLLVFFLFCLIKGKKLDSECLAYYCCGLTQIGNFTSHLDLFTTHSVWGHNRTNICVIVKLLSLDKKKQPKKHTIIICSQNKHFAQHSR